MQGSLDAYLNFIPIFLFYMNQLALGPLAHCLQNRVKVHILI